MKVQSLFLLPLALVNAHPKPPHGPPVPENKFTLKDITYESHMIYSTPSHLAVHYATVAFNLTDQRGFQASCAATDSSGVYNFFNWPQSFTCTRLSEHLGGDITFSYLGYNWNLQVNETWCARGRNYLAVSEVIDLKAKGLQCKDTNWQNPNWTWPNPPGNYQTFDTVCQPLTLETTPKIEKLN